MGHSDIGRVDDDATALVDILGEESGSTAVI